VRPEGSGNGAFAGHGRGPRGGGQGANNPPIIPPPPRTPLHAHLPFPRLSQAWRRGGAPGAGDRRGRRRRGRGRTGSGGTAGCPPSRPHRPIVRRCGGMLKGWGRGARLSGKPVPGIRSPPPKILFRSLFLDPCERPATGNSKRREAVTAGKGFVGGPTVTSLEAHQEVCRTWWHKKRIQLNRKRNFDKAVKKKSSVQLGEGTEPVAGEWGGAGRGGVLPPDGEGRQDLPPPSFPTPLLVGK